MNSHSLTCVPPLSNTAYKLAEQTGVQVASGESIPGSESPEKHAVTVWKEVLAEASATEIVVIAHSYGGVVTMALARNKEVRKNFEKRVIGVFLTDSVHYGLTGNKDLDTKMRKVGKNYVTSTEV